MAWLSSRGQKIDCYWMNTTVEGVDQEKEEEDRA